MSSLSAAMQASSSALTAELVRIEAATSNLANANSTRGPDGTPYRRRDVMLSSAPIGSFDASLRDAQAVGVRVDSVVEDQAPFRRRYEPAHPDAGTDGYVQLPNVDPAEAMVDLLGAARAYQANLAAVGVIREIRQSALDLGR